MNYSELKNKITENNFNFKKKYGQNFIIDENIINSIITKSNIDKDTLIIEVGPGAGSLTRKLVLNAGFVLCYEIDKSLKPLLDDIKCSNIKVIYEDFLKADVTEKIKDYSFKKIYVISNLPYYITTPIILKFIEDKIPVDKIVVMVQKEVGNRFKASVNSKDYNSLSIFLNYYFNVSKIMDISKNVFLPKPNVDSIVVEFDRKKCQMFVKDEDLFFKLIKDSFKQKRKTIKNNLMNYDLIKIEEVLKKHGFSLSSRAESIPIEVFADIANNL